MRRPLTANNQVLLATVAQKYPTPCTSSFWIPDCERRRDSSETTPDVEATGLDDSQESDYGGGGNSKLGQMAQATPVPESSFEKGEIGFGVVKIETGLMIHASEWKTILSMCFLILEIIQNQKERENEMHIFFQNDSA